MASSGFAAGPPKAKPELERAMAELPRKLRREVVFMLNRIINDKANRASLPGRFDCQSGLIAKAKFEPLMDIFQTHAGARAGRESRAIVADLHAHALRYLARRQPHR